MFTNKDNMKRQLNNSPKYMILADINSKKYIRSFNLTYGEIVYGKIKKIAPCGKNSFQTLNSKIIFPENVIYFFGGKYYKFSEGTSPCGGNVDMLFINKREGKFIKHKLYKY